jgi:pyruvate/2-oxoglutarate dehydrogenase complex dihydrolipoamide acyltransferase (E2) component
MTKKESYQVFPIPRQRRFAMDAGRLGRKQHIVHGLAELDVTLARQHIRDHEARHGEKLSFTAFIINCLGEAIHRHPELHAYRDWRGRLVIFDQVNINMMIEVGMAGRRIPMPYIIQRVEQKSYLEIHREIRQAQSQPASSEGARFMDWFLFLPWPLRRLFYWTVMHVPQWFRQHSSPVIVTAVGMFSRGASWAITRPSTTLTLALGGIAQKPGVVDGRIAVREFLHLTVSVDHDVVDGAPAARFGNELMGLIESGYGLVTDGAQL